MKRRLPIFPLNTVFFPGAALPLNIFEPRYREMLRDCMAEDRRFGVVLIKSGREAGRSAQPFRVGTVAHITEVGAARRGALPISVIGETRFRIQRLHRVRPYLTAEVEMIEDSPEEMASDEIIVAGYDATARYIRTMFASQGIFQADLEIPDDPLKMSYFMGMIAGSAPNRALQTILETENVADRIQAAISLLEEETAGMAPVFMRSGPGAERSLFSSN